jgi:hypothetical protein
MKYITLFENFGGLDSLNEDFMELKSIAKHLYSDLKKKGYEVEIKENSKDSKKTLAGTKGSRTFDKGGSVEIHQFPDSEEIGVFLPIHSVAYQFIVSPENKDLIKKMVEKNKPGDFEKHPGTYQENLEKNWSHINNAIFGEPGKIASLNDIRKDPEILKFVNKLGSDLIATIKSKYAGIKLKTEDQDTAFALYFTEPRTRKGAVKK